MGTELLYGLKPGERRFFEMRGATSASKHELYHTFSNFMHWRSGAGKTEAKYAIVCCAKLEETGEIVLMVEGKSRLEQYQKTRGAVHFPIAGKPKGDRKCPTIPKALTDVSTSFDKESRKVTVTKTTRIRYPFRRLRSPGDYFEYEFEVKSQSFNGWHRCPVIAAARQYENRNPGVHFLHEKVELLDLKTRTWLMRCSRLPEGEKQDKIMPIVSASSGTFIDF